MHRFAPAAFAAAFGLTVVAPLPLLPQHRATLRVGVTVARNQRSRQPVEPAPRIAPRIRPDADSSAKRLSLGRHLLVGAGVGAAAGCAIGIYSRNHSSDCNDCFYGSGSSIPVFGAVAGAAVGTVIGWFVYLARMSPPAD